MPTAALLRLLLVVALTLPTLAHVRTDAGAQTPEPTLSYEEALAKLDRLMAGVEELRAQIDRSRFDVEELGLRLGFEAEAIVGFVREEIAFEQYPGLLRGARGTLIGRAGNALDQAVLLATLLLQAGYEARIARGELSPEQAQTLVEQMAVPRKPEPPIGDADAIRAILTEMGRTAGLSDEDIARQVDQALTPPPISSTKPYRDAQADTAFVLTTLREAGIDLGDPDAVDDLVDEARDYFWVEYRLGPSDPWQLAHPAFKDPATAPTDVDADEYLAEPAAIPDDLKHRFRFQVFVEQWVQGELEPHPVIAVWEAPVANLVGVPVTFQNYPNGFSDLPDAFDLEEAIERSEFFIPLVNDAFPPDVRAFDLTGTPVELDQLAPNEYGATFDLGEMLGTGPGGVDLFGTPVADGEALPELTAEWIDYALVAPGGKETDFRRTIVDRIGAANRQANRTTVANGGDDRSVKAALLRHHTFAIGVGELSPAFVLDQALERFLALRPLLDLGLERSYFPEQPTRIPETVTGLSSAWAGYRQVYSVFDRGARQGPDIVAYRHEPSLMVYRLGPGLGGADGTQLTVETSIDVVSNARRAFSVAGGRLGQAAEHLVWTGVWETHAEALAAADGLGGDSFTTMAAFERAAAASIPLQVVTSEGDLASAELKLPAEALTNLRKDLANGYVAIVPTELPPDEEMTGWWRVDRRTGETLGITGDGRGQALNIAALAEGVEYSMGMRLILGFTSAKMYGALCFGGALAAGMSYAGAGKVALGCAWEGFALAGEFHLMHGPGMILNFILHVTPH